MKRFPIMTEKDDLGCPTSIPWDLIAPFEGHAISNHDQSLANLASRGGLSPREARAVIEGRRWRDLRTMANKEAVAWLIARVEAYEADVNRARFLVGHGA